MRRKKNLSFVTWYWRIRKGERRFWKRNNQKLDIGK